jgi:hypothetical protein
MWAYHSNFATTHSTDRITHLPRLLSSCLAFALFCGVWCQIFFPAPKKFTAPGNADEKWENQRRTEKRSNIEVFFCV